MQACVIGTRGQIQMRNKMNGRLLYALCRLLQYHLGRCSHLTYDPVGVVMGSIPYECGLGPVARTVGRLRAFPLAAHGLSPEPVSVSAAMLLSRPHNQKN